MDHLPYRFSSRISHNNRNRTLRTNTKEWNMSIWERAWIWWDKTLTKRGKMVVGFCAAIVLLTIWNWIF